MQAEDKASPAVDLDVVDEEALASLIAELHDAKGVLGNGASDMSDIVENGSGNGGANVPASIVSEVESVLARINGVTINYRIVVDRINNLDTMEVQVEMSPDALSDTVSGMERLRETLRRELNSSLNISVGVRLLAPRELERSEGKSKRVIDNRKLGK